MIPVMTIEISMNEQEKIAEIKQKLQNNDYFIHPLSDSNIKEDFSFLVNLLDQQQKRISQLEKKNEVLLTQVMDLNQEIENVKSDFGGSGLR